MEATKRSIRIGNQLAADMKAIAGELNQSENQVIEAALKLYRDDYYMKHKATLINDQILHILQALDFLKDKNRPLRLDELE